MGLTSSTLIQNLRQTLSTPIIRSGGALITSTLAGSGLGFLYWAVATRMLPVATVGIASALIASMTLVTTLSLCGLNFTASRFLPVAGEWRSWMIHILQIIAGILGAIGGAIFLAGSHFWAPPVAQLGLSFIMVTACWSIFTVQDHLLLGLGKPLWIPISNGLFGVIKLLLLIGIVSFLGWSSWKVVFWPWTIIGALSAMIVWAVVARHTQVVPYTNGSLPKLAVICRFALANHLGAVLLQLPPLLYPILVYQMLGQEATAYFYTSWMFANLVMLFSSNIASAVVTHAARNETYSNETLTTGIRYAMLLAVSGCILLILLGRLVLSIFGSEYQNGYPLLVILALGCPVYAANAFYAGLMRIRRVLRPVLIQGIVAGGAALALAPVLGATIGLPGFGVAYIVGQVLAAILLIVPLMRSIRWA